MSEGFPPVAERVRALARFLSESDAVRVRIVRGEEEVELARRPQFVSVPAPGDSAPSDGAMLRLDTIKADLVGIFHVGRPAPLEGDVLESDSELGYIEALGIRTAVHSMGGGRIVSIETDDGEPVEYGQPLFLVARG